MSEAVPVIDLARQADFALGRLEVRPSRREVLCDANRSLLEPRVMQVLVALAREGGEVVSRDALIASCWDGRIVGEDAINTCVAKVRRLGERTDAFEIETISRVGYRLVALEGSGLSAIAPVALAPARAAGEAVLAVLPFDNLSGDPDLSYFSDGVAEEILQTVAQRTGLKVIGRASSFQFRGGQKLLGDIARQLNATHVLDGAVRRSGERVRVSAQLVECADETIAWSDRFDGPLLDIFAMQDDIAAAVASALHGALAPVRPTAPVDLKAYDLYLQARASTHWLGRGDTRLLEAALALAPQFAPAWASLAMSLASEAWVMRDASPARDALRRRVREAASRALALEPRSGLAYAALYLLHPDFGAFEAQAADLERALQASPYDPWVLFQACEAAQKTGRCREALAYATRAREVEPILPQGVVRYATALDDTGRPAEAEAMFDLARERWPDIEYVALSRLFRAAYAPRWDRVDAIVADLKARGPFGPAVTAALENVETLRGPELPRAQAWIARERTRIAETGAMRLNIQWLCRVGRADDAYDLVEQATFPEQFRPGGRLARGDIGTAGLFYSYGAVMRADPRFVRLCAKTGLVRYWLNTDRWPDCVDEVAPYYDFKAESRRVAAEPSSRADPR